MACWRVLQTGVVQLRHHADLGAAQRQPSGPPRQRPPQPSPSRTLPAGRCRPSSSPCPPQPVQRCCQRSAAVLQVLQVAVAVEGPAVGAARPAAPVAGLRGARAGIVGSRPVAAVVALVEPGSGRDGNLPGPTVVWPPTRCHRPWPGCQAPTNPPRRRPRPSRSRMALIQRTPRRSVLPRAGWSSRRPEGATPTRCRSRFLARTSGRAGRALRVRVDLGGWLAGGPRGAPCGTTRRARCGIHRSASFLGGRTGPLRPSPPRGGGWPARGSRLLGSGDGRRASSGKGACPPWPQRDTVLGDTYRMSATSAVRR
jgi:hypothetical protein